MTEVTEPATITDPEWLRQQYAAAIQPLLMDTLPKPIAAARALEIADTVLFVRDRHLAQLRQRLQLADADLADWAAAESADAAAGSYAHRAEDAEQQRDQLAGVLAEALDAFEACWARASYCGPGETAVQPEHLHAWRAVLDGKEQL